MTAKKDELVKLFGIKKLNEEQQLNLRGGMLADVQTSGATTATETQSGADSNNDDCDCDWSDEGWAQTLNTAKLITNL